jgi:3-oxoadipate enol-lactonase
VQNFVSAEFFNTQRDSVAQIERLIGGETRLPACYVFLVEEAEKFQATLADWLRRHAPAPITSAL